jgi:hypothetical protein
VIALALETKYGGERERESALRSRPTVGQHWGAGGGAASDAEWSTPLHSAILVTVTATGVLSGILATPVRARSVSRNAV